MPLKKQSKFFSFILVISNQHRSSNVLTRKHVKPTMILFVPKNIKRFKLKLFKLPIQRFICLYQHVVDSQSLPANVL